MARMDDGYQTTISFDAATSGLTILWEKEVAPPGISAGGPVDTTTMRNSVYRTMAPKNLISLLQSSLIVAYDPAIYDEMIAMLGTNQLITITFPDAQTLAFWGFIDTFTPNSLVEGTQPTADLVIEPTNQNASGVETPPVIA